MPRLMTMPLRALGAVLILLMLSGFGPASVTNIGNEEVKTLSASGVAIYDVRRPDEWQQTGVIKGSQRLTFVDSSGALLPDFLPRFTGAIRKDQPVILVCRTGNRSAVLAKHLTENLGYTRVYNVRNGIVGWLSEGRPVVRE